MRMLAHPIGLRRFLALPLAVAVIATLLVLPSGGTNASLGAPEFNPASDVQLCNGLVSNFSGPDILKGPNPAPGGCPAQSAAPNSNPDVTVSFQVPRGHYQLGTIFVSSLRGFTSADDADIPDGALIGGLGSRTSLGLGANPCQDNVSQPHFIWWDATTDNTNILATQPPGTADRWSTIVTDDNPDGAGPNDDYKGQADNDSAFISAYPDFLNKLFDPDQDGIDTDGNPATIGDQPVKPISRYAGATQVPANSDWQLLQNISFDAGALQAAYSANPGTLMSAWAKLDPSMGGISLTILNDPTSTKPAVSIISDYCSSLGTNGMLLGKAFDIDGSEDGAGAGTCSDGVDNGPDGDTDEDDADCRIVRYTAPATTGSYMAQGRGQSARDVDWDGIENGFDTCPYIANSEDPYTTNGADGDMLDPVCDPTNNDKSEYDPALAEDGAAAGTCNNGVSDNPAEDDNPDVPGVQSLADEADPDCHDTTAITTDSDNDGYQNSQDVCPLFQNPSPDDSEPGLAPVTSAPDGGPGADYIGDDCDTDNTRADGDYFNAILIDSVCITNDAATDDTDNDGWCEADGVDNDGDTNLWDPGEDIDDTVADDIGGTFSNQMPDATDPDGDDDSSGNAYPLAESDYEWNVGVDAMNNCPLIPGHHTWPPDVNSLAAPGVPDGASDIFDITQWTPPVFGATSGVSPLYVLRKDLTSLATPGVPDGAIDIFDIVLLTPPVFGKRCQ